MTDEQRNEVAEQRYQRAVEIAKQTFDQTVTWTLEDLIKGEIDTFEAKYELETAIASFDLVEDKAKEKRDQFQTTQRNEMKHEQSRSKTSRSPY